METWETLSIKEKIQYICAIGLIASGVILAFICAIFNFWEITNGVLIYIAQAFVTAGGIFGVSVYFKSQLVEFESKRKKFVEDMFNEMENKLMKERSEK